MSAWGRLSVLAIILTGIVGCEGVFLNNASSEATKTAWTKSPWTGRWVGRYESSLGLFSCPARGLLEFHVAGEKLSGHGGADGARRSIEGRINRAGVIHDGFMKDGARAVATLTGTFGDKTAAGRWASDACEGVWTVWRFKQPG